ncbi:MAG: hypothetical protein K8U57_35350 [Planctomycetes bacterium]|nr:hypothetical protein [Planctomycetota bacterium]
MLSSPTLKWSQDESGTVLAPPSGQRNLIQRALALADLMELFFNSYESLLDECIPYSNSKTSRDSDRKDVSTHCAIWKELDEERKYLLDHLAHRVRVLLQTLDDPEIDRLVDIEELWQDESLHSEMHINKLAESYPSSKELVLAAKRLYFVNQ